MRRLAPPVSSNPATVFGSLVPDPMPMVYQRSAAELAFLFRSIPVKERQLRSALAAPRSGVRFPLHSGKGTPAGGG
jgi:hypothetical protein